MEQRDFLLPEVSIFCHRPAESGAGRQLSISIESLVRLMLHKEQMDVQERLATKAIALLQPESFVAPTGLSVPFVFLNQLPTVAKRLIAIFIDDDNEEDPATAAPDSSNIISPLGRGVAFLPFRELQAAASDLWTATDILFQLMSDIAHEHGLASQTLEGSISSRICVWGAGGGSGRLPASYSSSSRMLAPAYSDLPTIPTQTIAPVAPAATPSAPDPPAPPSTPASCAPVVYNGSVYIALYPAITYINGNTSNDADARRWFNRAKPHLRPSAERGDDLPGKISGLPGQISRTRYSSFSYVSRIVADGSLEAIIPKERLLDRNMRMQRWKQICMHIVALFGPSSTDGSRGFSELDPPAAKRAKLDLSGAEAPAVAAAAAMDLAPPNYAAEDETFSLLQRLEQQIGDEQHDGVVGVPILNENALSPMIQPQPQLMFQQHQQQQQSPDQVSPQQFSLLDSWKF